MKRYKVYLFRHGQTSYNRDGRFTGWNDAKLTKEGFKQARKVARKLKGKRFEVAFFTHLIRSKQTLKEILKYHPECKRLLEDDRMIERNYGDLNGTLHSTFIKRVGKKIVNLKQEGDALENLEGKKRKEVEKFLGTQEYDVIHRGFATPPPRGESFADVEKRVKKFIKYLRKFIRKNKVNVAISAHGNSIRLFRKIMENASIKETVSWDIPYDKYFEYDF